jgi:hypothetical protein
MKRSEACLAPPGHAILRAKSDSFHFQINTEIGNNPDGAQEMAVWIEKWNHPSGKCMMFNN